MTPRPATTAADSVEPSTASSPDPRRWAALAVIAASTLMVVLDNSIVTIALPQAQIDLGIADADRQWVVTAYALAFGGLLLLGGRLADFVGRKRMFLISVLGFAVASAVGGLAVDPTMLFGARALQGAFAAVLAPAGLSLILVTFEDTLERAKAFGVYGAVQGAGGAIGLILGGVLTEYFDWRWTLLVNVPIALIVVAIAVSALRESRSDGDRRYDVPGAILATAGLAALVYAFTLAATESFGWTAPTTIALLAGGVLALVAFAFVENRSSHPLLPLRVLRSRNRGGALLGSVLIFGGMFGMFLFLTFYFQINLGYSPIQAGLAFLPFSAGIILTSTFASTMLPRFGAKPLLIIGSALGTAGLLFLTLLNSNSSYASAVLPAALLLSFGLGLTFVPISVVALQDIAPQDAGVGAAALNVTQQVGGALGTAILNTIYISAVAQFQSDRPADSASLLDAHLHGYQLAFTASAAFTFTALVVFVALISNKRNSAVKEAPMVEESSRS
jgi:EmrB/QacA subfamily drug resistance transporter